MNDTDALKVKRNLSALVEFSRIINSSLDLQFILNNILLTCMGKFFATKGLICININGRLELKAFKGLPEEQVKLFPQIDITENFLHNDSLKNYLGLNKLCATEQISSSEEVVGIICLGEKLNKHPYSADDLEFLRTILNISAAAIQNSIILSELKKVNRVLDSRVERLNSLFELSKEFGLLSESTGVEKLLVYSIIGQFLVSKYAVVQTDKNEISILGSKFPEKELKEIIIKYELWQVNSPLTKEVIKAKYPELYSLKIELGVPMQIQGTTKGFILLGKRINNADYTSADVEFILSVGSLAMIALENKKLFIEALEKQKLEEELDIARDIQRNLLPHKIPAYSNYDIAAMNLSSKQVGGDYYDLIELDPEHFCFAIADVSGKGVPAALLMANLQAFLKTTCRHGMNLDEATGLINDLVSENTMDGKFITFFWGILSNKHKKLTYVNAGHNHPLLIRDGKIRKLDKGGMILGVMKTFIPYEAETVQLEKDDVLVLFTDGVSEAMSREGEEFSDERLEEIALANTANQPDVILENIKVEVQKFSAGAVQSDDITLIVIKVK